MADEARIEAAVGAVRHPDVRRPLGELGLVRQVRAKRGRVTIDLAVAVPGSTRRDELERAVVEAATVTGAGDVEVSWVEMEDQERLDLAARMRDAAERTPAALAASGTRVVTISSGKGGVGKSSVTANLAVALTESGKDVGVIDADVWGFSIPKMLGVERQPAVFGDMLVPPERHGVRVISMEYFVPDDQAVIWRGPMLHKALEQFLADVYWDRPDFLLVDMPPGTGDVAISISQFLPRAQAVVVTTPQPTAQRVAKRAALMAKKVEQEVIGVVENMSWFTGDDGVRYPIFGEGGGEALAAELGVSLLGKVPLLPAMREGADAGLPVTVAAPDSEAAQAFREIAAAIDEFRPRVRTHPELVIR